MDWEDNSVWSPNRTPYSFPSTSLIIPRSGPPLLYDTSRLHPVGHVVRGQVAERCEGTLGSRSTSKTSTRSPVPHRSYETVEWDNQRLRGVGETEAPFRSVNVFKRAESQTDGGEAPERRVSGEKRRSKSPCLFLDRGPTTRLFFFVQIRLLHESYQVLPGVPNSPSVRTLVSVCWGSSNTDPIMTESTKTHATSFNAETHRPFKKF